MKKNFHFFLSRKLFDPLEDEGLQFEAVIPFFSVDAVSCFQERITKLS